MNKLKKVVLAGLMGISVASVTGCTDATMGKLSALGGSANVKCYSAEKLIYSGDSTGKVISSSQSDGYYFIDRADRKLKEVSGNCVITYKSY